MSGKELAYEGLLGGLMGGVYGAPGMVSDAKALKLPSVQTETNPVRVSFAERNAADLSRINADLSANLRTADGEEQLDKAKASQDRYGAYRHTGRRVGAEYTSCDTFRH